MNTEITLIGLTGRAGSGKDTAGLYLAERYGFVEASFAEPIREMACMLAEHVGLYHSWVTEPSMKNLPMPGFAFSARQLMQRIGTEAVRTLDPNAWITALARHVGLGEGMTPVHDRIVITDVRFPNEAAWLELNAGHLLRLQRTAAAPVAEHESERHIDAFKALDVDNDGTLHQLHTRLDCVCQALGLDARG